jgi:hypothetical protein
MGLHSSGRDETDHSPQRTQGTQREFEEGSRSIDAPVPVAAGPPIRTLILLRSSVLSESSVLSVMSDPG